MSSHPDYELFEEIGRGTYTVVYRAYDRKLKRYVAIKQLLDKFQQDTRRKERFLKQAQFLANLDHDNLAAVYTLEPEPGWIVMELMQGSMETKLSEGAIDAELAISVLKQSLTALDFLHGQNKIHGKVRPSNILVNDQGRVKLSDFENIESGAELPSPTGEGKYLAPELVKSEAFGKVGPQLDLYCLGFTTLELLSGSKFPTLFKGIGHSIDADVAWMRWHSSSEELASSGELVRGLPEDLSDVLDQMLKKQVSERASSAKVLLDHLTDAPLKSVDLASSNSGSWEASPASAGTAPDACVPRPSSQPDPFADAPKTSRSKPHASSKSKQKTKPFKFDLNDKRVLIPVTVVVLLLAAVFGLLLKKMMNPEVSVVLETGPEGVRVFSGEEELEPIEEGGDAYVLPQGEHELTFRKDGYIEVTKRIEVEQGMKKVSVNLEPSEIEVAILVDPPGATVSLGDKELKPKNKGSDVYRLSVGKHILSFTMQGYRDLLTQPVDVQAGTKTLGPFKLEPDEQKDPDNLVDVKILFEPADAVVWDGDRQLSSTEPDGTTYRMTAGQHDLVFRRPSYIDRSVSVTVDRQNREFGPFRMQSAPHKVTFVVRPEEAKNISIRVGDKDLDVQGNEGTFQLTADESSAEKIAYAAKADGYEPYQRSLPVELLRGMNNVSIILKPLTTQPIVDPDAQASYESGLRDLNEGNYDRAIHHFTQALRISTEFAAAFQGRGKAHAAKKDFTAAIADLRASAELMPNGETFMHLGHALADFGELDDALAAYEQAIKLDRGLIEASTGGAVVCLRLGKLEDAREYAQRTIDVDSTYSPAHNLKGLALRNLDRPVDSLEAFSEAIVQDPTNVEAYYYRGKLQYQLVDEVGDEVKAVEFLRLAMMDFNKVIDLNPELAPAYNARGLVYSDIGEKQKAIEDFNEAIRLNPMDAKAYFNRGLAYKGIGQLEKWRADNARAISMDPELGKE